MESMTNNGSDPNFSDTSLKFGKWLANPEPGEEVCISGMSAALPQSNNIDEFQKNLYNKVDMITHEPKFHSEIPTGQGRLKDVSRFDAGFFVIHKKHSLTMDPGNKILLEKVIECILDAGLNPDDLAGTKTGVFFGVCAIESAVYWWFKNLIKGGNAIIGNACNMYANRISYFLKLKGPSMSFDTGCSSVGYALEKAYYSIRTGLCDNAFVCSANINLIPPSTLRFARLGVLSPEGISRPFDEQGNGYVRASAVAVVLLQKSKNCKRIYARVLHVKVANDGFKEQGITYPSGTEQYNLLREIYFESGINPKDMSYIEAHSTGTQVGDPEEVNCIDKQFARCRDKPVLVGSVKSNSGHAEAGAALSSIIKAILAFETNYIAPNLNYSNPRKSCSAIHEGRIKVVDEKTIFGDKNGLIGVSSFGFGGSNFHSILKWNLKRKINHGKPTDDIPRLVCVSGRTKEAVHVLLDDVVEHFDVEQMALLYSAFRKPIRNHLYRGYVIVSKTGELGKSVEPFNSINNTNLYIYFAERANNLVELVLPILHLPILKSFKTEVQHILSKLNIDLVKILEDKFNVNMPCLLLEQLGQLTIAELLKELQIEYKEIYAHSFGKLTLEYFKGRLSLENVLNCMVIVENIASNVKNEKINGNKNQTILGVFQSQRSKIVNEFERILNSAHEPIKCNGYETCNGNNYIKSSEKTKQKQSSLAKNIVNDILEDSNNIHIPQNGCIIEIGQNLHFLHSKQKCNILRFSGNKGIIGVLVVIGRLYVNGLQPMIQKLFPVVLWPVGRGTPMISPRIKWKHDSKYFVYSVASQKRIAKGVKKFQISLNLDDWSAISGHIIDGRNLFPATGYLYLAWTTFVDMFDLKMNKAKVIFENCKFKRACTVPEETQHNKVLDLTVMLQKESGYFEITEGGVPVVTGNIKINNENTLPLSYSSNESNNTELLNTKDIYKELRLRGYNYKGKFKSLRKCNKNATSGELMWADDWIAFLDNMLQMKILGKDSRLLYVPIGIRKLSIDPEKHLQIIKKIRSANPNTYQAYQGNIPVNVPVYANPDADTIWSGGIEFKGVIASSIPRKRYTGIPVLESYQFVPNEMQLSTESTIRVFMQVALENNCGIKIKTVEVLDEASEKTLKPLIPIVQEVLADQPLVQSDTIILSNENLEKFDINVKVEKRELKYENDCTLVIASRLSNRPEVLKEAIKATSNVGFIISREISTADLTTFQQSKLIILNISKTNAEKLILLTKQSSKSSNATKYVNVNSTEKRFDWLKNLKERIKEGNDLVVWCQNEPLNGVIGLVNCIRREPGCQNVRSLFIMDTAPPFDPEDLFYKEQLNKNMSVNVYKDKQWGTYRHLLLGDLQEVSNVHCFANSTIRGDLSSIKWIEGPLSYDYKFGYEETLVEVYYSSLNFRDVMTATGRINAEVISQDRKAQECILGLEFSGRTASGKRIMGMVSHGSLATLVKADTNLLWDLPKGWSLKEAATVPVVYGTVLHALVHIGRIKPNQTILIHSGTGGIGQAAINICVHIGCPIFTTVGTEEKREFIKKNYPQINEKHIGNSRDTNFEQMIMRKTNGKGVDLILNSLAEDKLFASVRCLSKNGMFLEIGKFDLANNTFLDLMQFKNGACYHGVMLDKIFTESSYFKLKLNYLLQKYIDEGAVKPIITTVFDKNEVEEALRYMSTGKHIGKVLIRIKKELPNDTQTNISVIRGIPRYYCDPEKSYIICGGLGGFGLEFADWLVLRGARNLVLTTRRGISNGYQSYRISIWQNYGCKVKISTKDLTTETGCLELIKEAQILAPVHSIFNLAVILKDAILENQAEETFQISFGPKADATHNLDKVSRNMCPNLRDFVVFSSASCGRGNAGQSNYGMANSVMERICEKRRQEGFPALAIEWGAVGDVGLVAELLEEDIELEIGGTLQQKINNCIEVLDILLKQNQSTIVSSMVVAEKKAVTSSGNIIELISAIIGIKDLKAISVNATLPELGMDSMNGVEIKRTLEREFNLFLTPTELRNMTFKRIQEKIFKENSKLCDTKEDSKFNINSDELLQYMEKVNESGNSYIKLETKTTEKNPSEIPRIIVLPGVEGSCEKLQNLTKMLEVEAFGINYISSEQKDTIPKMADNILMYIKDQLQPKKPFNLVAHSLGAILALELTSKLEQLGYIGSLYLVDGAPILMKEIYNAQFGYRVHDSDAVMQDYLIAELLQMQLPATKVEEVMVEVSKCSSFDDKLKAGAKYVQFEGDFTFEHMKNVCQATLKRARAVLSYTPSFDKLRSKVLLFKPTIPSVQQPMPKDYDLGQYCQNPIEIKVFEGTHNSILESEELALFISACLLLK